MVFYNDCRRLWINARPDFLRKILLMFKLVYCNLKTPSTGFSGIPSHDHSLTKTIVPTPLNNLFFYLVVRLPFVRRIF
jgi:hypothetical protein